MSDSLHDVSKTLPHDAHVAHVALDVLVAGSGAAGLACAIRLALKGVRVAAADPMLARPTPPDDDRAFALSDASRRCLRACGEDLWDESVEPAIQPIRRMEVLDRRGGGVLELDAEGGVRDRIAGIVESAVLGGFLRRVADDLAAKGRLELVAEGVADVDVDIDVDLGAARISLSDGTTRRARLIIAADGSRSTTREALGIVAERRDDGLAALTRIVEHDRSHRGTARQAFDGDETLALLPLIGRRSSMVWSAPRSRVDALLASASEEFLAATRRTLGGLADDLGELREPAQGRRRSRSLERVRCAEFVARRALVVGDAAHASHPLAGLGLNLGLGDVREASDAVIAARRRGSDVGGDDVLADYSSRRAASANALADGIEATRRLFASRTLGASAARRLGLRTLNRIAPLKRTAIRLLAEA